MVAAAERLSFTPSAISQQISALEREAGVALVERQGRRIRLTDAAKSLVEHTEAILSELSRAEADLVAVRQAQLGSLTIGAFPTSGTLLVPAAMRIFADHHPAVTVRIVEVEPENSLPMVRSGELDLAIAFECDLVPLAAEDFETRTLFREPMLLVHSPDSVQTKRPLLLSELKDQQWIAPAAGTAIHEFTLRACGLTGYQPMITSTWTDFQVVQSLAAQRFGVAFVPQLALSPPRRGVVVTTTEPNFCRSVFAAWRSGNSREPLVKSAVDAFRYATKEVCPSKSVGP
jgi:DNA-binding transcriptional LysR family regulator